MTYNVFGGTLNIAQLNSLESCLLVFVKITCRLTEHSVKDSDRQSAGNGMT